MSFLCFSVVVIVRRAVLSPAAIHVHEEPEVTHFTVAPVETQDPFHHILTQQFLMPGEVPLRSSPNSWPTQGCFPPSSAEGGALFSQMTLPVNAPREI